MVQIDYNVEDIEEILTNVLGKDADGIYLCYDIIEGIIDDDDLPIYTKSDLSTFAKDYYYNSEKDYHVDVYHGISRIVLNPTHLDYIIKLSVSGLYDYRDEFYELSEDEAINEKNDDVRQMYNPDDMYVAYKLCSSKEDSNHKILDLMEQENQIYRDASSSLKQFLLPYVFVEEWHGIKVYIQKKIESTYCNTDCDILPSNKYTEEQIKEKVSSIAPDKDWQMLAFPFVVDMIAYSDEETIKEVLKEITNCGINDLHASNYGYTADGTPCIFDYTGIDAFYWSDRIPESA